MDISKLPKHIRYAIYRFVWKFKFDKVYKELQEIMWWDEEGSACSQRGGDAIFNWRENEPLIPYKFVYKTFTKIGTISTVNNTVALLPPNYKSFN